MEVVNMLIEFRFKNYRSFRDETVLSMEASGISSLKKSLIPLSSKVKLLPSCAIYGKNGSGKTNVIRAFWLAVQFIRNAQRTQHDKAPVPVRPFSLNDYSRNDLSEFEFTYLSDGIRYWYGFSATREKIFSEYLYHAPKGQKALIFDRKEQNFSFTEDKAKRTLIGKMVAENQLFFSIACTMNDAPCALAMHWFRNELFFSHNYPDIPGQILEYAEDKLMLKAISDYAKTADLGILDVKFEINNKEVKSDGSLPNDIPEELQVELSQFMRALSATASEEDKLLQLQEISAQTIHQGINKDGQKNNFLLELSDESDGTRKLMALAPAIESALRTGGVLLVDELERELHPHLVNFIVAKFQSKDSNTKGSQLIFTTHNTELLNLEYLRKDQIYFVDKKDTDGSSELYSLNEFSTRTSDNIRKAYLIGKYGATPNIEIEEVE